MITNKDKDKHNDKCSSVDSNNDIISVSNIINDILDRKILEILKLINNVYPDKFPKKNIKLEFEFIKSNIKFEKLSKNSNKILEKTAQIIKNTIKNDKSVDDKSVDDKSIDDKSVDDKSIDDKSVDDKKQINNKKCNIESKNRCNARIWNNIYDRNTLKEVSDIDKKFKVKDFVDIKIKEFHGKYIVGTQCRRKKSEDNIYCYQHKNHCPHGNYFEIPPKELCLHFMKDGNYL